MRCERCGHELPHLIAVLAQTHVGTQCPKCWAPLRRLVGDHGSVVRKRPTVKRSCKEVG